MRLSPNFLGVGDCFDSVESICYRRAQQNPKNQSSLFLPMECHMDEKCTFAMRCFVASLLPVVICATVWAQSTAQITGTVKDQTGAVLPGVEITATQTGTGL